MKFRKDINGLRAIAVIAVVLFHFNENWMPGGFAGVDVFFVISGFLMTGIIFRGLEQDTFSILKFYVARANRIIPVLAAVSIVLLIFGWFYIIPTDYKILGKHIASSLTFISNMVYWLESGYFDASSHEKWLLHTWSLSVEWQFYIIYPLILIGMRKFMSIKRMKLAIFIGTILGFAFCIIAVTSWANASYYLLPTRAWEMMVGGVAYLYPIKLKEERKRFVEWSGLALILASYVFISKTSVWPGYLTLLPVLGAFLVIQASRNDSIITSNIIAEKIGAWSYSIYLWHWPLVAALFYFSADKLYIYPAILAAIVLGFLSNKHIEKIKFRNDFSDVKSYLKCKPLYMVLIVGIIAQMTFLKDGFEWHYPQNVVVDSHAIDDRNPYRCMEDEKFPCYIGNKENIRAIVVGDSHADSLTTGVAHAFDLKESGIVSFARSSCPLIKNMNFISPRRQANCFEENVKRMAFLKSNYPDVPVFWIARTAVYIYFSASYDRRLVMVKNHIPLIYFTKRYNTAEDSLLEEFKSNIALTINELTESHPVYIVQPLPEMKVNIPITLAKNKLWGIENEDLLLEKELYLKREEPIRKLLKQITDETDAEILDPMPYLCNNDACFSTFNGRAIYYDHTHMSEYGNKLLTPMFKSAIDSIN